MVSEPVFVVTTATWVLESSLWIMAASVHKSEEVSKMVHPFLMNLLYCKPHTSCQNPCNELHQNCHASPFDNEYTCKGQVASQFLVSHCSTECCKSKLTHNLWLYTQMFLGISMLQTQMLWRYPQPKPYQIHQTINRDAINNTHKPNS